MSIGAASVFFPPGRRDAAKRIGRRGGCPPPVAFACFICSVHLLQGVSEAERFIILVIFLLRGRRAATTLVPTPTPSPLSSQQWQMKKSASQCVLALRASRNVHNFGENDWLSPRELADVSQKSLFRVGVHASIFSLDPEIVSFREQGGHGPSQDFRPFPRSSC